MNWYLKVLKQYADFNGRARRKEYWSFLFINMVIESLVLIFIMMPNKSTTNFLPIIIYSLAITIPTFAVSVRRMHDIGKSGWMMLIQLIPVLGGIWFLILTLKEGDLHKNRYGSNPKKMKF